MSSPKVLITGASGFIGRHLYKRLSSERENIIGVGGLRDGIDLVLEANVGYIFDQYKPDVVIHLAGRWRGIEMYLTNPAGLIYENMWMSMRIIEEARQSGCSRFITIGDISCYPENCPLPFSESDLWNGRPTDLESSYAIYKRTLMELNDCYQKQFDGFKSTNVILSNVYGEGDDRQFNPKFSKIVPMLISNLTLAKEEQYEEAVFAGDKYATHDLLHVDDVVEGIIKVLDSDDDLGTINIGSMKETSNADVINIISEICGYEGRVQWEYKTPIQRSRSQLDTAKAKKLLGFSPSVSIEDGISRTYEWAKDNFIFKRKKYEDLPPLGIYHDTDPDYI